MHRERCKPVQIQLCISDWLPNVSLDEFLGDFWAAFPWGNWRHLAAIPYFISAHGKGDSRALPAPCLSLISSSHQAFFNKHFTKVFWWKTLVCRIRPFPRDEQIQLGITKVLPTFFIILAINTIMIKLKWKSWFLSRGSVLLGLKYLRGFCI